METLLIQATLYVVDYFGRYGPIHNQFQQDLAKAETEFDANYTEVKWLSASELLRDNFLVKNQKSIYAYRRKKKGELKAKTKLSDSKWDLQLSFKVSAASVSN